MSAEAKKTLALVSELNNNHPCSPVDPNMILTTDDTSLHIVNGVKNNGKDKIMMVSKETIVTKSYYLLYDGD